MGSSEIKKKRRRKKKGGGGGEFGAVLTEAIEGLPAEMREGAVASRAAVLRALTEMMYTALTMERAPLESLLARRGVQGCSQLLTSLQQARSSCALSSSLFAPHPHPIPHSLSPGAGEAPLQLTQAARGSRCVECSTRGGEGHTLSSA